MIHGAVFDVDGVLLNSMKIWNDLGARYLHRQGIAPEPGLNGILFSMSMEQGAAYLKSTYRLPDTEQAVLQGIQAMLRDFYFNEVLLKPGVTDLLDFLKGHRVPLALATSSPREHITRALERNGILCFFGDHFFTTGELGISKHRPDIYYRAAESLGAQPSETLVFEDSLYALTTAENAGFLSVGVFDADGESNQDGMKQTAQLYLTELSQFEAHWSKLNHNAAL